MHSVLSYFLILIITLISACSKPKELIIWPEGSYLLIKDVNVIDVEKGENIGIQQVLIKDEIIYQIDSIKPVNYPDPIDIIDGKNTFLIPGLIDMHAHVTVLPIQEDGRLADTMNTEASMEMLSQFLAFGITTIRNPAAPTLEGVRLRDTINSFPHPLPTIFTAGSALNRGYFGPFVSTRTEVEVRKEIAYQAQMGVDYIKVYAALPPVFIQIAIEEAHKYEIPVIGHLQQTSWTEASRMGIDFITHAADWHPAHLSPEDAEDYVGTIKGRLDWIERVDLDGPQITEMLRAMKENNVSVDPTLLAFHTKFWAQDSMYTHHPLLSLAHPVITKVWNSASFVGDWGEQDFRRAQDLWPKLGRLTYMMYKQGIMLTTGSDFPNPWVLPGISLHEEMALLAAAGIPNAEVLKMATINGAMALKQEKRIGSVDKGKVADLLLLSNNPLDSIANSQKIELVIKNGIPIIPSKLKVSY